MRHLIALLSIFTFLTSSTLHAQPPSYVPTDGLVGWWPFNGNANDESGNGNNGVVNGATLIADRFGNANGAYSFSQNNSNTININTGNTYSQGLTIAIWAKPQRNVIAQVESNVCPGSTSVPMANTNQNWLLQPYQFINPDLGVGGLSMGTNSIMSVDHGLNLLVPRLVYNTNNNDFMHVILIYDMDSTYLYVNGQKVRSRSIYCSSANKYYGPVITIGGVLYSSPFYGIVDDFGLWARPLQPCEIEALYNATVGSNVGISSTPVSLSGLSSSYTTADAPSTLVGSPSGGTFIGPGVTGNTFDPASAGVGTHSITYTWFDACGGFNTTGLCTTVEQGVGIGGSNMTTGGVLVYPNPNRGQFTVELELTGLVGMRIFDTRGALVHNEVFTASGSRTQRTLDLSAFAKGSYTLLVEHNGQRVSQAVVVE
jgi:hypothetical protein